MHSYIRQLFPHTNITHDNKHQADEQFGVGKKATSYSYRNVPIFMVTPGPAEQVGQTRQLPDQYYQHYSSLLNQSRQAI